MQLNLNLATHNILFSNPKNFLKIDIDISKEKEKIMENENHKPTFLIPVIDRSGSMSQNSKPQNLCGHPHSFISKLECAKSATKELIDLLSDGDKIAIVAFDDCINICQKPILINPQTATEIKQNIENIYCGGCTNISDALETAQSLISDEDSEKYNCKIILLSDGYANVGFHKEEQFIPMMTNIINRNISTSTIGLGNEYDLSIMETISGNCAGSFTHVSDARQIEDIFAKELKTAQKIAVKDAKLVIHLPNMVSFKPNFNHYTEKYTKDTLIINLGNLYNNKTIYYEFELLNPSVKGVEINVDISYKDENSKKKISASKNIHVVTDKNELIESKEIIYQILNIIKDNYVYEASKAYSTGDSASANSAYSSATQTINQICTSYCVAQSCHDTITTSLSNSASNMVSCSTDELRTAFSVSSNSLRNS